MKNLGDKKDLKGLNLIALDIRTKEGFPDGRPMEMPILAEGEHVICELRIGSVYFLFLCETHKDMLSCWGSFEYWGTSTEIHWWKSDNLIIN